MKIGIIFLLFLKYAHQSFASLFSYFDIRAQFKGTVVCITHDRYFLENVAGWILELDRGEGIPFEGNYSGWLEAKNNRLTAEKKEQSASEKAVAAELGEKNKHIVEILFIKYLSKH